MIEITQKSCCCGCNACGDICPKQAISFSIDMEGFWYPAVDKVLCINCGLCDKVCPVIHSADLKRNDSEQPVCYAAENKNLEVVFDSTSGGLFSALADFMYKSNGFVGGAVFNEDFTVSHYISDLKSDLPRLRSSKYLQSNAEKLYKTVKILLDEDKSVLVCGTPCQMAALSSFLGKKYDKLIIVDFICRGVNSPKVWKKYITSFEERYGSPVVYAKAKSKEYGWRNLTQKVVLANGKSYFETGDTSNFTKGYLRTNAYCRPSCYECKFKGFPGIADITLADFWGIENYNQSMEKNLGTSLVLLNTDKGKEYFAGINQKITAVEMPFESIFKGNQALTKPLDPPKVDRTQFFKDLDQLCFTDLAEKYINNTSRGLKSKIKYFLKKGYKSLRFIKLIVSVTRLHPKALFQTIRYSGCKNLFHMKGIIFSAYCTVQVAKTAKITIDSVCIFGYKDRFPKSKLETRLLVADGASLSIKGKIYIGYGSDIEVLENADLVFKGGKYLFSATNIGCTIVCGQRIEIGHDVEIGRNVMIRDNNGNHYINRQGYKNSKPVVIGDKVWLCEGCIVMPGAKIDEGAVVGARSFVASHVHERTMVAGNPAKVIDEDILWKY